MTVRDDELSAVVVTGLGLTSAVGYGAAQTATSLRAGITRLVEVPSFEPIVRDPAVHFPEPLIAAPVNGITKGLSAIERLLALGLPALREALEDAGLQDSDIPRTALLVAGGQRQDRAAGSRIATLFVPRLAQRASKETFHTLAYLPSGSAGFLIALRHGMELLTQRNCAQCVIGGVDSWLDQETLAWLDEKRRLKSQSTIDAFIPGEAASFVVLELQTNALRRRKQPYVQCCDVAVGHEQHTIWTDTPCTAEALASCLRTVLAGLARRSATADVVLCDLNGESYRSTEWAYATTKAFRDGQVVPPIVHPADCIGDVGAATAGVLMGLAASSTRRNGVPWTAAILWCASDDGERAAGALLRC